VGLWWAAWIVSWLLSVLSRLGSWEAETTFQQHAESVEALVADVAALPAVALAMLVVIKASRRLEEAYLRSLPPPA
jgi:hypothetical protein